MSKLEHLKNSNPQPPPTANVRVEMFIDDLQDLIRLGFETGVPNGAIASALADEEYNVRVANQRLRELLAEVGTGQKILQVGNMKLPSPPENGSRR
jgi:hypothetical protein